MIKNTYTVWGCLKLVFFVLRSKLISRKIRIIRFPIELRGAKYIDFGKSLTTGVGCRLEAFLIQRKNVFFLEKMCKLMIMYIFQQWKKLL